MPVLHNMQISGNCYKVRLAAKQLGFTLTLKEYPEGSGMTRRNAWFAGLYGYTHCAEEGGFELARYPALAAWLKRVASVPNHIPMSESR